MPILKCKMCGGDIELSTDKTFGTCDSCGSTMTFPKVNDEQRADAFNRGNHFRRIGEFDKALSVYERIVQEDPADAEAHWCCALCRFGIEYVEDPATFEYIPTCHRASFDIFTEDVDYLAAVDHADGVTKRQYIKDGAKIAEVQRGILATSQNEKPFDVFICYKESDENGNRTVDSTLAQDIYYQLTDAGLRVFFARITLEDKVGSEYEPYIFAALNSAKAMVAVGTKPEYFKAVWVKNEWSRYLAMVKHDRSKVLLPCYRDMDPYDLPEQLSVLQSYDMSKIGFIQDLIRGIKKITATKEPKEVKETVVVNNTAATNTAPLLKRAFIFLEDGDWQRADDFCEQVLNLDPENGQAYLGKLMAELKIKKQNEIVNNLAPLESSDNYKKAVRFGDEKLRKMLKETNDSIKERNILAEKQLIYDEAVRKMHNSNNADSLFSAAASFTKIKGFKDVDKLAKECEERAAALKEKEQKRKSTLSSNVDYRIALESLEKNSIHFVDSDNKVKKCICKAKYYIALGLRGKSKKCAIDYAKRTFSKLDDYEKVEQCKVESARIDNEMPKAKKAVAIGTSILAGFVAIIVTFLILLDPVIIPKHKLNKAMKLIDDGDRETAYSLLDEIWNKGDIDSSKFDCAMSLMECNEYRAAIKLLVPLATKWYEENWNKVNEKLDECEFLLQKDRLSNVKMGDTVKFGYEARWDMFGHLIKFAEGEDEEIEWIVLDVEEDKALIISKYAIAEEEFDSSGNTIWADCTLRQWLNNDFLDRNFNKRLQNLILSSSVPADENPVYRVETGNDTTDKIFLLSSKEAEKYFDTDESRQCSYSSSTWRISSSSASDTTKWWLRTPSIYYLVSCVSENGSVDNTGYPSDAIQSVGVRPAMWIEIG